MVLPVAVQDPVGRPLHLGRRPLYYVFWGLQRLRSVHALLSYATWTRYFSLRCHDPETQQKQLHHGVRMPGDIFRGGGPAAAP